MRYRASLLALFVFSLACPSTAPTQQPPDEGPKLDGGDEQPDGARDQTAVQGDGAKPPRRGPQLPDGQLCEGDADCGEGQLCEGVGCEPGQGRCVPRDRMCTRDLATYCGCDAQEFQSSGSCPGRRYAYRGPCQPALEDGEPCTDGRQCRSGQCVGDGLEGCTPGAQGVCGTAACTKDLASYCGCNNTEFRGSGSCPNRQFAYRGPCEAG